MDSKDLETLNSSKNTHVVFTMWYVEHAEGLVQTYLAISQITF